MRTNWITRRVHSRLVPRPVLSTCRAGRRRCRRPVVRGFSCGCRLALLCLLRASRAIFPAASLAGLLAIRSVLSSYRSAPRSFDKWGGAMAVCVSVWVRLGCCRLLLAVVETWMWLDGVSLVGLARCRRVDGVGRLRDFRRSCCLPWAFLSVWCVSLAPVACFALVVVVGRRLIVIGCCRRGSASSSWVSVVVVSPHPACPRVSSSSVLARGASAVDHLIDRLVDRFAARLLALSCLSCGVAAGGAGSLSSRCVIRCLGCRSLGSVRLPWVAVRLVCLLIPVSVSCGRRCRWHVWSWLLCPAP